MMAKTQAVRKQKASRKTGKTSYFPVLAWAGLTARSTLGLLSLLCCVLVSGLLVVKTTHQNRFTFNELQQLKDEAVALDVAWGQLLIEQSTFGVEGRIEQKAVQQLDMRVPEISDIVMVDHD